MKKYLIWIAVLVAIGTGSFAFFGDWNGVAGPAFHISEKEYDFGVIKQSGGIVSHDFIVRNIGSENAVIESLPASCACTSAEISKREIASGESAVVTVFFDPNLHEEPKGKFFKTVEMIGNVAPHPEFKIYAEVDVDLGPEYYKLQEKDND